MQIFLSIFFELFQFYWRSLKICFYLDSNQYCKQRLAIVTMYFQLVTLVFAVESISFNSSIHHCIHKYFMNMPFYINQCCAYQVLYILLMTLNCASISAKEEDNFSNISHQICSWARRKTSGCCKQWVNRSRHLP